MRQPVPFGKYLLLDRVSVGGMAEVFKAKSYGVEGFEKVIAIKRILPSMGEDQDFIKMFIDEAKIAGQLSHANICQIFELGRSQGAHFIAMEYIWGKDLLQLQNRFRKLEKPLPVPMACYIVAKVCEGLHYAHKKRDAMGKPLEIVHRDCSPQNVLVSYEGEVKLIDFGIARAASRSSRTNAGVLKGKFGYMSPEQVRGLPLDHRSDIFAVGTILYESLTGARLFLGESDFSTLEKVRNADVRPPRHIRDEIPAEVEEIVMKSLQREVRDRYQWASEMQADLKQYLTAQQGVFTQKNLAELVKTAFRKELERERDLMEKYKRVGRGGLIAGKPQAEAKLDVDAELGEAGEPEGDPTAWDPNPPGFDPEGPTEEQPKAGGARGKAIRSAGSTDQDSEEDNFAGPTEIYGEIASDRLVPLREQIDAEKTQEPDRAQAATDDSPPGSESHKIEVASAPAGAAGAAKAAGEPPGSGPGGAPGQPPDAAPVAAPEFAMGRPPGAGPAAGQGKAPGSAQPPGPNSPPSGPGYAPSGPGYAPSGPGYPPSGPGYAPSGPGHPPSGPGYPPGPFPPTYPGSAPGFPVTDQVSFGSSASLGAIPVSGTMPVARPRQGALVKDIVIGVVIAGLVLGLFAAGRYLLFSDEPEASQGPAKTGTLVVVVSGAEPAQVSIDGDAVGVVKQDGPLRLELDPDGYAVRVERPGTSACARKVQVEADGVEVVSCPLEAEKAKAPALVLEGITDQHRVFVDDEEVSPEVTRGEIKLEPDKAHRVVVKLGEETVEELTVTLGAGEQRRHRIEADEGTEEDKEDKEGEKRTRGELHSRGKPARKRAERREVRRDSPPQASEVEEVGWLIAHTTPWARVYVDGKDTGKSTPVVSRSKIPLEPGRHKVTFVVDDKRFSYPITITAGQVKKLVRELPVGE